MVNHVIRNPFTDGRKKNGITRGVATSTRLIPIARSGIFSISLARYGCRNVFVTGVFAPLPILPVSFYPAIDPLQKNRELRAGLLRDARAISDRSAEA